MLKLNLTHFGDKVFGVWILLASIWGFGSVFDFGFGTAILKYVAQYKGDKEKIDKILSSSFFVYIIIGTLIFIISNFLAYFIYINDKSIVQVSDKNFFLWVSFILGFSFLLQYWGAFFRAVIDGLNNFVFTSRIAIVQTIILFLGVLLISILNYSLLMLAFLYLLVSIFVLLSFTLFNSRRIGIYKISISAFDMKEIKDVISFSLSIQAMAILNTLIDPIIKYLIGNYYSISAVSSYEIARRFAVAISGLFTNTFKIIMPKASSLKLESEQISFVNSQLIKYCNFGVIYSGITFGISSLPLFLLIYFVFKSQEALLMFAIISLPESINNFGFAIYSYLIGVGRMRLLIFIQLNNLLFVIVFVSIGFILLDSIFGLTGYFFSVIIANISMVYYLKKHMNLEMKKFIKESNIYKLMYLLIFMITAVTLLYLNVVQFYLISFSLTCIMLVILLPDIRGTFKQLIKPFLREEFL